METNDYHDSAVKEAKVRRRKTNQDAAVVLREARAVLDRDGWCQGRLHNDAGQHCALGALYTAGRITQRSTGIHPAITQFERIVGQQTGRYNDELKVFGKQRVKFAMWRAERKVRRA